MGSDEERETLMVELRVAENVKEYLRQRKRDERDADAISRLETRNRDTFDPATGRWGSLTSILGHILPGLHEANVGTERRRILDPNIPIGEEFGSATQDLFRHTYLGIAPALVGGVTTGFAVGVAKETGRDVLSELTEIKDLIKEESVTPAIADVHERLRLLEESTAKERAELTARYERELEDARKKTSNVVATVTDTTSTGAATFITFLSDAEFKAREREDTARFRLEQARKTSRRAEITELARQGQPLPPDVFEHFAISEQAGLGDLQRQYVKAKEDEDRLSRDAARRSDVTPAVPPLTATHEASQEILQEITRLQARFKAPRRPRRKTRTKRR